MDHIPGRPAGKGAGEPNQRTPSPTAGTPPPATTREFDGRQAQEFGNPRATRRTDFDYVVAAGWVRPAAWTEIQVGRRRWVSVPLYRTGDLDAVRDLPDVDWEAVRSCRPGDPSPLRAFAPREPSRAQLIHRFTATLAARYHTQVWAVYDGPRDRWRLGWEPGERSQPTLQQVAKAIADDPTIGPYRGELTLDPPDQEVNT